MDNVIELAKGISKKIFDLPEAIEYLKLKGIVEKDEDIQSLQKAIIEAYNSDRKEEAEKLLSRLNEIPIVSNFNQAKEELANTLKIISDILK